MFSKVPRSAWKIVMFTFIAIPSHSAWPGHAVTLLACHWTSTSPTRRRAPPGWGRCILCVSSPQCGLNASQGRIHACQIDVYPMLSCFVLRTWHVERSWPSACLGFSFLHNNLCYLLGTVLRDKSISASYSGCLRDSKQMWSSIPFTDEEIKKVPSARSHNTEGALKVLYPDLY